MMLQLSLVRPQLERNVAVADNAAAAVATLTFALLQRCQCYRRLVVSANWPPDPLWEGSRDLGFHFLLTSGRESCLATAGTVRTTAVLAAAFGSCNTVVLKLVKSAVDVTECRSDKMVDEASCYQ